MSRSIGKIIPAHLQGRLSSTLVLCLMVVAGVYSTGNALHSSKARYESQLASGLSARGADIRRFHQSGTGALIAHGGGIGPHLYANSAEAVSGALARGFTFIELDLLKTRDNHLLAAHDWGTFCELTGTDTPPDSLQAALQLHIAGNQRPLSGDMINNIMQQHPEMILVTDKISDFELLLQEIPHPERMIVEVFSPQDYVRALNSGILYPAFCVTHSIALQQAVEHRYPIITISVELFLQHPDTMRKLHQEQVCIMVYGTESLDAEQFIREHAGTSASMIYTSTISPDKLP